MDSGTMKNWKTNGIPGLVNIQKTDGKITMFNGKIHYKWPFSIAMSAITRGYTILRPTHPLSLPVLVGGLRVGAILR